MSVLDQIQKDNEELIDPLAAIVSASVLVPPKEEPKLFTNDNEEEESVNKDVTVNISKKLNKEVPTYVLNKKSDDPNKGPENKDNWDKSSDLSNQKLSHLLNPKSDKKLSHLLNPKNKYYYFEFYSNNLKNKDSHPKLLFGIPPSFPSFHYLTRKQMDNP